VSLKVIPLLQVFSSAIFHICGTSHCPSASAELLVAYRQSIRPVREMGAGVVICLQSEVQVSCISFG